MQKHTLGKKNSKHCWYFMGLRLKQSSNCVCTPVGTVPGRDGPSCSVRAPPNVSQFVCGPMSQGVGLSLHCWWKSNMPFSKDIAWEYRRCEL